MEQRIRPKIISIGYAVPEHSYSEEQIFKELGYPKHFWRIFRESQIEKRHFCLPLEQIKKLSFQEQQEEYIRCAEPLSKAALLSALDDREPGILGLITYSTCTGFPPGPTIAHLLADDLHLNIDTQINNLSSQGCEAAFPGLRRCYDFTSLTGRASVAIACELCCLTYYPELGGRPDPENDYELLRSNAVFADGCSCAIVGFDDNPKHPEILDFASCLDTSYAQELGYVWRNGRLRVRLSKRVPDIAVLLISRVISNLLCKNRLNLSDICHWVIHPPGAVVLDKVRDTLGIPEERLKYSRKCLRLYGNTSSSAVGIVGKLLIDEEVNPEGYIVMLNVGPGMVSNATLMRFGRG